MLLALAVLGLSPNISPTDPRICYVGRFDRRDGRPACQWSASEVRLKVKGTSLIAQIEESGEDEWIVEVDGYPRPTLTLYPGSASYTIPMAGSTLHDVRFIKRTEAFVGTTRFLGFQTPEGTLFNATPQDRRIEFVGDSITCAFGVEGANQDEPFKPQTENAYLSYASVAGRELQADVSLIAWSGRKMWPDFTVPEIYDRVLPNDPKGPKYDFKGPKPQVVVIHLATNDFGKTNPEEKAWTGAYEKFIRRVWSHYPKAHVYVAMGSMMSDNWPPGNKALTTLRRYLTDMVARMHNPRLHFIEFDVQRMEDGIGSGWHPNVVTQDKMGRKLAAAIKRDLKW